ncbi:MAG TPA: TlpA disulfide reductase family protein [Chitinophagaceae bacterium]|nr:TlpA disulfide reductase family protein [Chitinophagaceae bacterium]
MRKIILPVLLSLLLAGCQNKDKGSFIVSGTLRNASSKMVYIEETNITSGEKKVKDSSAISSEGKFSLKVEATEEGVYNLRLQNDAPPFATIINDASKITVDADFNKQFDFYTVSGSKDSKAIQDYLSRISEMQRDKFTIAFQADSIRKNNGDSALAESLNAKQKQIAGDLKTYTQQTVQQAQKAPFAFFVLATYQGWANNPNYKMNGFSSEELIGLLNEMVNKFPGRTDIAGVRNSVESQIPKTLWVGKVAPEISLPDTEGRTVRLSSFRGKYVLVDFWASWCGPCRRENPTVVEAYNQFRNKNFTILGVSLDRPGQKEAWIKAIVDDKLNWTHVSDLKYWQSEVVPVYQVGSIPFNVLVDPEGKVIAENLRGYALEQKLQEVLN